MTGWPSQSGRVRTFPALTSLPPIEAERMAVFSVEHYRVNDSVFCKFPVIFRGPRKETAEACCGSAVTRYIARRNLDARAAEICRIRRRQ
jgi:hypothetical protein